MLPSADFSIAAISGCNLLCVFCTALASSSHPHMLKNFVQPCDLQSHSPFAPAKRYGADKLCIPATKCAQLLTYTSSLQPAAHAWLFVPTCHARALCMLSHHATLHVQCMTIPFSSKEDRSHARGPVPDQPLSLNAPIAQHEHAICPAVDGRGSRAGRGHPSV